MSAKVGVLKAQVKALLQKKEKASHHKALKACQDGLKLIDEEPAYDSKNYDAAYFLFFMGELATEPPLTAKFYEQAIGACERDMLKRPDAMEGKLHYSEVVFQLSMLAARATTHPPTLVKCIAQCDKAHTIAAALRGPTHISVLRFMYATALLQDRLGQAPKAIALLEKAYDIANAPANFKHQLAQTVINLLVHMLVDVPDLEKASTIANAAFERILRENVLGKEQAGAESAKRLAVVRLAQGRVDEAEKVMDTKINGTEREGDTTPLPDADAAKTYRSEQSAILTRARDIYFRVEGSKSPQGNKCAAFLKQVGEGKSMKSLMVEMGAKAAAQAQAQQAAAQAAAAAQGGQPHQLGGMAAGATIPSTGQGMGGGNGGSPTTSSGAGAEKKSATLSGATAESRALFAKNIKAQVSSAQTQDDAEKLLGIAEALFRQEQNFLLAEHVLQKCADIFGAAAAQPNASEMTKKREEVSNYNLKIMRRNRIIELWDEVIDEALEIDMGGLSIGAVAGTGAGRGGGGGSSGSAAVPAVSFGMAAAAVDGDLPAQDETLAW